MDACSYFVSIVLYQVPFFSDDEETVSTPKADALFLPRDNPRALVIRPTEQWPLKSTFEKASQLKDTSTPLNENGKSYYVELYNVLGVKKYRYQKKCVLALRQIVPISKLFVIT